MSNIFSSLSFLVLFLIRRRLSVALLGLLVSMQAHSICWWWQDCTQYQTKYPIVLVHGFGGFDSLLGFDYFYRVPEVLQERGATVFVANVSAVNSTEVRGEQLLAQVQQVLAITGAEKVNLIGHSHGAPTSRYVAGVMPDVVASVTSVSGANFGADLSDLLQEGLLNPGTPIGQLATDIGEAIFQLVEVLSGTPDDAVDAVAAASSLTTAGADAFNQSFPDGMPTSYCGSGPQLVNGVHYFSWAGDRAATNILDAGDLSLSILDLIAYPTLESDGVLATCDMPWGKVIGLDYNMNHLDTVNHLYGIHHIFEVDPLTLYRNQAVRLKGLGL